jgi:putative ABC transport system permease protein
MTVRQRAAWSRVGLRLARREVLRAKGRAVLVVALVLVPTAVMAGAVTVMRTSEWPPEDRRAAEVGSADVDLQPLGASDIDASSPEGLAAVREQLPEDSPLSVERRRDERVRNGHRRVHAMVSDLQLDAPMNAARVARRSGQVVPGAGEVVVTDDLARDLHLQVGDSVELLQAGVEVEVVGTVGLAGDAAETVFAASGPLLLGAPPSRVLVDLPDGVTAPPIDGWRVREISDADFASDRKSEEVFWTYLAGAVGLMVVGTVASAAFAVGARRRLRTVGLLSSTGAPPQAITTALVAEGVLLGAVGSALGIVVGVVVVALAIELVPPLVVDSSFNHAIAAATLPTFELLPIVVIGTSAAAAAAWLPARTAGRTSTLQALAGRRPLPKVPARLPLLGAGAVALGIALLTWAVAGSTDVSRRWALLGVAGAVCTFVGTLALAPWIVSLLERTPSRWPAPLRLATRSLARNRVRSAAVVAAIVAVTAPLVAGATIIRNDGEQGACCETFSVPWLQDDQVVLDVSSNDPATLAAEVGAVPAAAQDEVSEVVGPAEVVELPAVVERYGDDRPGRVGAAVVRDTLGASFGTSGTLSLSVATPEVMDLFDLPRSALQHVEDGEALLVSPPTSPASGVWLQVPSDWDEDSAAAEPIILPVGGVLESEQAAGALPLVLVSEATVVELGYEVAPSGFVVFEAEQPLTDAQREELSSLNEDLYWREALASDGAPTTFVSIDAGSTDHDIGPLIATVVAYGAAAGLVLLVVAIALSLAAKDEQAEGALLLALGASPRVRRRASVLRATTLVVLPCLFAAPIGVLIAASVLAAQEDYGVAGPSLLPDWPTLGFVLVGLPLVTASVVWFGETWARWRTHARGATTWLALDG